MIEDEFFIYVHIHRYGDFNTLQLVRKDMDVNEHERLHFSIFEHLSVSPH
jgi:hypothetical protein